jgi:hypothetical protein
MSTEDDACEYSINPSDEEIEATAWLMKTLDLICKHRRPNADKAKVMRELLHRIGHHQIALHEKIHELEGVLHSKGYFEVKDCPGCEECERKDVN